MRAKEVKKFASDEYGEVIRKVVKGETVSVPFVSSAQVDIDNQRDSIRNAALAQLKPIEVVTSLRDQAFIVRRFK
jgi:hypothetical protein